MPIPYAQAGVEKTLATSTCPVTPCGQVFYGTTHKKSAAEYAKHYEKAHLTTTVDGLVDPSVVPEGTKTCVTYLLGRTEKNGLLTAGIVYGEGQPPSVFFLTDCCGASVTYSDSTLCCKGCWYEVDCSLDSLYDVKQHGAILPPTDADRVLFAKSA